MILNIIDSYVENGVHSVTFSLLNSVWVESIPKCSSQLYLAKSVVSSKPMSQNMVFSVIPSK